MEMLFKVKDRPPVHKIILTAIQHVLAVLAGTIAVPLVVGNGMSQSAALLGAGVGTLVYLLITGFRCPVFLGSSFSFVGALMAAFAGATSMLIGYSGLLIGAVSAGIVYIVLGIVVKFVGTRWIDKIMPPVIIGPVVATIGLSLSPNAINNLTKGGVVIELTSIASPYLCIVCGLVALFVSVAVSVYSRKTLKLIPFIVGIFAGYLLALIFTLFGNAYDVNELKIIDFSSFENIKWVPDLAIINAVKGFGEFESSFQFWSYFVLVIVAYVPVALVTFAEHIADHKNLGFIVGEDFIKDPGLHRTLIGDGTGSIAGAILGGCPNTTYGESISCVAISRNASVITLAVAAVMSIAISFFGPLIAFFATIPPCVVGGICIALYGFIALSGFQMLHDIDLTNHKNLFVVASILVAGIGGLSLNFQYAVVSPTACALVIGILMNLLLNLKRKDKVEDIEENKKPS